MTKAILLIISAIISLSAFCQAPANLRAQSGVEYLIVCNEMFRSQALEIAGLHPELTSLVVSDTQVYSEFSSGKREASAIRDLARHLYRKDGRLRYLLLLGDGSTSNNRDSKGNTNLLPTYQRNLPSTGSIMSDDFYGILSDDYEGLGNLDIGVGRIPVKDTREADIAVSKIRQYIKGDRKQAWRKNILFVADDENRNLHAQQSEHLAERVEKEHPKFDVNKLYIDSHRQMSSTAGDTYPTVNQAIRRDIEGGILILNYTGHGGMRFFADERILTIDDIDSLRNFDRLPLVITASCNIGNFDCYDSLADRATDSPAEHFLHNPNGGAIALIAPTREVQASNNFRLNNNLFDHLLNPQLALGDIVMQSKNSLNDIEKLYFALLGDPALRLSIPGNLMQLDSINGVSVTEYQQPLKALGRYRITGSVKNPEFFENGTAFVTIRDKRKPRLTMDNDGEGAFEYQDYGNTIFKGECSIRNGCFSFTLVVPKDIDYDPGNIKVSLYAANADQMASGFYQNLTLGGTMADASADWDGPEISIAVSGIGHSTRESVMVARLSDPSGINVTGASGHAIELILDGETRTDITYSYVPDTDDFEKGTVSYSLGLLPEGIHSIAVKAWDNYNNPSEKEFKIAINGDKDLAIYNLRNYPNPFAEATSISFAHNGTDGISYEIRIYTASGKMVCAKEGRLDIGEATIALSANELPGKDGIYIYRLEICDSQGRRAIRSEKFVILR